MCCWIIRSPDDVECDMAIGRPTCIGSMSTPKPLSTVIYLISPNHQQLTFISVHTWHQWRIRFKSKKSVKY